MNNRCLEPTKENKFVYTTAIRKLRKLTKRIKVIPGGTSAGKTYGILPILIDRAARTPGLEISVVSESIPHLRKGALKDFLNIMKNTNRYVDERFNRTLLTYSFANGSYIEFFSADQEEKTRGPRRNVLYVNECNNISFETYHQLAIRTSDEIWLDFNPSNEFWVHKELAMDSDSEWLTLTYKDNEALHDSIVREIEKARDKATTSPYWENWWKVYGLGQLGILQGAVFQNWKTIKTIPEGARLDGHGLDWGFSNDPLAMIDVYRYESTLIFDERIYQTGLTNSTLISMLSDVGQIIADSAEPKSIAELSDAGFNVVAAHKGPDSIKASIRKLQEFEFYVTERSVNLIRELRRYVWQVNRDGGQSGSPVDHDNHAIDAMRYWALNKLVKQEYFEAY